MTVIQMSDRELTRLRVMIDLTDGRLTAEAAAALMSIGRRQLFRLRRAFASDGPTALISRKRGRPGAASGLLGVSLALGPPECVAPVLATSSIALRAVLEV